MSAAGPPQGARDPSGLRAAAPGLPAQAGTARRGAGSDGSAACKASEVHAVTSVGALVVLDTNIVLDAFVFSDAAALPLRAGLEDGSLRWIATPDMRIELARVLGYAQIVPRLAFYGLQADEVLAAFDRHARRVEAAPKAPVTCADPDDQIFIDLAVRHRCALLSKDRAVLRMRKRLAALGVHAGIALAHQPA
jgi:predicted nucleic acid-binding protein